MADIISIKNAKYANACLIRQKLNRSFTYSGMSERTLRLNAMFHRLQLESPTQSHVVISNAVRVKYN